MWIKEEVNDIKLGERLWSGAVDTWREIEEAGKTAQAMQYFEEMFCDEEVVDICTINDILWMEFDDLMRYLGLDKESKEWSVSREELEELKGDGVLSDAHIEVIENNFVEGWTCADVTYTELNDAEELSDEELEELDRVVS